MALQTIKRRLGRWIYRRLKVSLWWALGFFLMYLFIGWILLVILKCIYFRCIFVFSHRTLPYSGIPGLDKTYYYINSYLEFGILYVQYYTYMVLVKCPLLLPIWDSIPTFDPAKPFHILTDIWKTLAVLATSFIVGRTMLNINVGEEAMPSPSYINVYGSNIGVMNTGVMDIRRLESIAQHLEHISSTDDNQIAYALREVTRAVTETSHLDNSKRSEVLDQLNGLAQQAALPEVNRSIGISRALVNALSQSLEAAGNLADVWGTWGETIKRFFGIQS